MHPRRSPPSHWSRNQSCVYFQCVLKAQCRATRAMQHDVERRERECICCVTVTPLLLSCATLNCSRWCVGIPLRTATNASSSPLLLPLPRPAVHPSLPSPCPARMHATTCNTSTSVCVSNSAAPSPHSYTLLGGPGLAETTIAARDSRLSLVPESPCVCGMPPLSSAVDNESASAAPAR